MIETLEQWNTRLGYCGCCPMPVCPAPVVVCQTLTATIQLDRAYDDGDVPAGAFNLALWKVYRSLRVERTSTANYDVDNTSTGGFHIISTGSLTTVANEEWSSLYWKYGGAGDFPSQAFTYSGDGSFVMTTARNFTCAGVTTKEEILKTTVTATHLGGADENNWERVVSEQEFFFVCSPPLTPNGTNTTTDTTDGWSYDSVHPNWLTGVVIEPFEMTPENPVTWAEWLAGAEAALPAWIASRKTAGLWASGSCEASYVVTPPTSYPSGPNNFYLDYHSTFIDIRVRAKPVRFRFRIPTSHGGSKFYITYDIAEFPEDGDPSFVSQDNVVEWTGPGTGSSSDPSWLTPWVEIDPPTDPGERRIVNIRFTCYSGTRYGSKPQVMGEALEIPPP